MGRSCMLPASQTRTLAAIVVDYQQRYAPGADAERDYFRKFRSLRAAIHAAASATNSDGKRFAHQRRLPRRVLQQVSLELLAAAPAVRAAHTFAGLFQVIDDTLRPIHGVGELMVYDTALRLGAYRGVAPGHVYLHAGTRVGARALGLDSARQSITVSELPSQLRRLRPDQIEDVLCIYKRDLAQF